MFRNMCAQNYIIEILPYMRHYPWRALGQFSVPSDHYELCHSISVWASLVVFFLPPALVISPYIPMFSWKYFERQQELLKCNLPSCHRPPNSTIWQGHCRATEKRRQNWTRGHTVDGTTGGRWHGSYATRGWSSHVEGTIHKMIVQPAMLNGVETVLMIRCHAKKREVTEMRLYMDMLSHIDRPTMWEIITPGID